MGGTNPYIEQAHYKTATKKFKVKFLPEGKIVEVDTPENIRNSKNPLVQQFITGSAEGPIKMKVRAFA